MTNSVVAYEVSAFSDEPRSGSPTGVVLDAGGLSEAQMRRVPKVLGVSHTAYLGRAVGHDHDVTARFFTPAGEIKNCGHATIAAHYLMATRKSFSQDYVVRQKTVAGVHKVRVYLRDSAIHVAFEQDRVSLKEVRDDVAHRLLDLFQSSASDLDAAYPIWLASPGAFRFMLPLKSRVYLQTLVPDHAALKDLCHRVQSIGCFAYALEGSDGPWLAHGRMFAPAIGVDEDVINGNSSGCLGALLARTHRNELAGSTVRLVVHQGHRFGRPGQVFVEARESGGVVKTLVGGRAVLVGHREIAL